MRDHYWVPWALPVGGAPSPSRLPPPGFGSQPGQSLPAWSFVFTTSAEGVAGGCGLDNPPAEGLLSPQLGFWGLPVVLVWWRSRGLRGWNGCTWGRGPKGDLMDKRLYPRCLPGSAALERPPDTTHLSVRLSVRPSIHQSTPPSTQLAIHLSILYPLYAPLHPKYPGVKGGGGDPVFGGSWGGQFPPGGCPGAEMAAGLPASADEPPALCPPLGDFPFPCRREMFGCGVSGGHAGTPGPGGGGGSGAQTTRRKEIRKVLPSCGSADEERR